LAWIRGGGWNYSVIPGDGLPSAEDLEGLTGGRPAFLVAYDAHTNWLNRPAMERLGITDDTQSVPFGELVLDEKGRPTGVLQSTMGLSDEAARKLYELLPRPDPEAGYRGLTRNFADAVRFGLTTIVDPQVPVNGLAPFERARDEGHLKSRLQIALDHPPGTAEKEIAQFDEARKAYNDDRMRVKAVKLYIDDVIEPHTAALLEPYADLPEERGETFYPPEEFKRVVTGLDGDGFQLFIHAIGDRGIRVALDALEEARRVNGARDSRHQLVHVELLSPEDIPRFKELDVVACMQPRHCAPDITGKWAASVGPERWPYAWAFRSLEEAGATLAFSSDWDVAEMDPLVGIYSAVTRRALDRTPPKGWVPEQTVSVETAIRAYTLGGAYANFVEQNRGSIEVGKYADIILLSDNLLEIPPERILNTRVVLTLVGGEEVFNEL
jgi:predicted amidohydrolase YtcJ